MSKVLAGHQPNYLPYGGFFDKMREINNMGDEEGVFLIADGFQYVHDDYLRRNRIRINKIGNDDLGFRWLKIPIRKNWRGKDFPLIHEIEIENIPRRNNKMHWAKAHLRDIHNNYKKTPYFDEFYPGLEEVYLKGENFDDFESYNYKGYLRLSEFNTSIIQYLANCFRIKVKFLSFSRDIPIEVKGRTATETLANLTRYVNAEIYLSGPGGKDYLEIFSDPNIKKGSSNNNEKYKQYIKSSDGSPVEVVFQNYEHPTYPQRFPGFVPYMSSIDMLFNLGYLPHSGERI